MANVTVSLNGTNDFEKHIKKYIDDVNKKLETLVRKLSEKGVGIAQAYIDSYPAVFTGELRDSISSEKIPTDTKNIVFVVKATSKHAIFVEMGTGKVGAEKGYKGKLPAVYAQGTHIFETKEGKYGWIYYNEVYDKWLFTEGMESRPFMYNTSLMLQDLVVSTAKEVFR